MSGSASSHDLTPAERTIDLLDRLIACAHETWPVGGRAPAAWTAVLNDASALKHDLAARVAGRPDEPTEAMTGSYEQMVDLESRILDVTEPVAGVLNQLGLSRRAYRAIMEQVEESARAVLTAGRPDEEQPEWPPMNFEAAQEIGEPMDYSPIRPAITDAMVEAAAEAMYAECRSFGHGAPKWPALREHHYPLGKSHYRRKVRTYLEAALGAVASPLPADCECNDCKERPAMVAAARAADALDLQSLAVDPMFKAGYLAGASPLPADERRKCEADRVALIRGELEHEGIRSSIAARVAMTINSALSRTGDVATPVCICPIKGEGISARPVDSRCPIHGDEGSSPFDKPKVMDGYPLSNEKQAVAKALDDDD